MAGPLADDPVERIGQPDLLHRGEVAGRLEARDLGGRPVHLVGPFGLEVAPRLVDRGFEVRAVRERVPREVVGWPASCSSPPSSRRGSPAAGPTPGGLGRGLGRLALLAGGAAYILVVWFARSTSWGGTGSLFEQHAFLIPVPFPAP